MAPNCGLNLYFPADLWCWAFLQVYWLIHVSSFMKCLFISFAQLLSCLPFTYCFIEILYVFWMLTIWFYPRCNYQIRPSVDIKTQEARENWKPQARVPMFFSTHFSKLMQSTGLKYQKSKILCNWSCFRIFYFNINSANGKCFDMILVHSNCNVISSIGFKQITI